jgi:hypothetical protein
MSEWWTYRLSDLLMFSARSYWRLTEALNRDLWPGQLVAVAAGIAILSCLIRPGVAARRGVFLVLGAAWAWVGWSYHLQRYADINTGAPYFAAGFALQALLLWGMAARSRAMVVATTCTRLGLAFAGAGVFIYPSLALAGDHGWRRAEVFGIVPDPTAVTTLGVLLALRAHPIAWLIPTIWCAISSATLMELGVGHAWLPITIAVLAIGAGLLLRRRDPSLSLRANSPT